MIRRLFWIVLIAFLFSLPVLYKRGMLPSVGNWIPANDSFGPVAGGYGPGESVSGIPAANAGFAAPVPGTVPGPGQRVPVQGTPPVYFGFASPSEYINFNITPEWVKQRWPQASIGNFDNELTGFRVPLVSGPMPTDLHGSLTYCFDSSRRLQRILFRGWTGDTSAISGYFVTQYGFDERSSKIAAGFLKKMVWGRTEGFLRFDNPPVGSGGNLNERYMVLFEVTNPSSSLEISEHNLAILAAMGE
jgi:hypothetical protein